MGRQQNIFVSKPRRRKQPLLWLGLLLIAVGIALFAFRFVTFAGWYSFGFLGISVPFWVSFFPAAIGIAILIYDRRIFFGWLLLALGIILFLVYLFFSIEISLVSFYILDLIFPCGFLLAGLIVSLISALRR